MTPRPTSAAVTMPPTSGTTSATSELSLACVGHPTDRSPESAHQVIYLFGDRGIPYGVRFMNSYYGHTLKLINKVSWCIGWDA